MKKTNFILKIFTAILLITTPLTVQATMTTDDKNYETALFAGGCFWCMEAAFDEVDGVAATISGFSGGQIENPSYAQVSAGNTKHRETLQVTYDPKKVSYEKLLQVFWHNIDPTDAKGQFSDRGHQYSSAIFYLNAQQKTLAEKSKTQIAKKLNTTVVTEILPANKFYRAEDYHQDYHQKNPVRYKFYKYGSGRPQKLKDLWGKKK